MRRFIAAAASAVALGSGVVFADVQPALAAGWINSCQGFGSNTDQNNYCEGGGGASFRTILVCKYSNGSSYYHTGPWRFASGGLWSYAVCDTGQVIKDDWIEYDY
jgi:opacity protein-like surface antigen